MARDGWLSGWLRGAFPAASRPSRVALAVGLVVLCLACGTDVPDGPAGASSMPAWMDAPGRAPECPRATVTVDDAAALQDALDEAGRGTVIRLDDGVYRGTFTTQGSGGDEPSGTPDRPVWVCGGPGAVLDGGDRTEGYVLHLEGIDHWVVQGFTVRNGLKGVMADGVSHVTIRGLTVHGIGDEAIHLRRHSTDNLVTDNTISDTGRRRAEFGEGVYIGSAHSNWCDLTDCEPDRSDRNRVVGNVIFATTAEAVDVKEGTVDGVLRGNQLDGSATTAADSWVAVKGNDWVIEDNAGRHSPQDGFQTNEVREGWGTGNVFRGNVGTLDDEDGRLVAVVPELENTVRCGNRLRGDVGRLSNVRCEP